MAGGRAGDVLELVGHHVDGGGEDVERGDVVIAGDGVGMGDVEGGARRIGAEDVGLQAEGGCRDVMLSRHASARRSFLVLRAFFGDKKSLLIHNKYIISYFKYLSYSMLY